MVTNTDQVSLSFLLRVFIQQQSIMELLVLLGAVLSM